MVRSTAKGFSSEYVLYLHNYSRLVQNGYINLETSVKMFQNVERLCTVLLQTLLFLHVSKCFIFKHQMSLKIKFTFSSASSLWRNFNLGCIQKYLKKYSPLYYLGILPFTLLSLRDFIQLCSEIAIYIHSLYFSHCFLFLIAIEQLFLVSIISIPALSNVNQGTSDFIF